MALTSALFTGLSGLDVNQTKLNVVGNNIANVNTTAFKSSRALFKPQFYVTDSGGTPASGEFGGQNPSQRGLGAQVSAIQKDFSGGQIEATGKATDLAVDGDGFFIVKGKEQRYTRDGSFNLNSLNQLTSNAGDFVQGFGVDDDGNIVEGTLQNIEIPLGAMTIAKATETAGFQGNLNANGATAAGASILTSDLVFTEAGTPPTDSSLLVNLTKVNDDNTADTTPLFADGDVLTLSGKRGGRDLADMTLTVEADTEVSDLLAFFNQGMGINTSVAGPTGFDTPGTSMVADATLTLGSRLNIIGNAGEGNALAIAGTGLSSSNPNLAVAFSDTGNPVGESVYTTLPVYDSLGTELNIAVTMVLENKTDAGTSWRFFANSTNDTDFTGEYEDDASLGSIIGTGTLNFDNDGKLLTTNGTTIQMTREATGAGSPLAVQLDFSQMTSLSDTQSSLISSEQDGLKIGVLNGFSVGSNGIITGAFSNGLTRTLGQVALATFDNQDGLIDAGGNLFTTGPESGNPKITAPQRLSSGSIRGGALELSNVDLSEQFINMIIASTGFTAASRVISTSDQLLTELLNTTR